MRAMMAPRRRENARMGKNSSIFVIEELIKVFR
jgi:hypothetical protein